MTVREQRIGLALLLSCAAVAACRTSPAQDTVDTARDGSRARSRIALSHALPRLDGGRLAVTLVEVTYGPGEASLPHSHPCPVIGYVVEGALRTQVKGEPEAVHRAGETFYEGPDGVHLVSANASQTQPTRFLAYFTCDRDTPLTVAAPAAHR